MAGTVVVRTRVDAAQNHVFKGRKEELIAAELQGHGIPARNGPNGVFVTEGDLQVHEEDGLRVFTWTPPADTIHVPVPDGDTNLEVHSLQGDREAQTLNAGDVGSLDAVFDPSLDELRASGAKPDKKKKGSR